MTRAPLLPSPRPAAGDGAEWDVVGLGEISLDHRAVLEAFPGPGQKQALEALEARPGGQMASALIGCARLGLRSSCIGAVGADAAAETALAPMQAAGIDVSCVQRVPGAATRSAIVLVRASDGERAILAHRDPALAIEPGAHERQAIERARVLMLDVTDPDASLWAARVARAAGVPCALDADHTWPGADTLLPLIDFPVVAAAFAEEYGETGNAADGLQKLAGWGARLSVVTLGPDGAMARGNEETLRASAFSVVPRDTTGAGDAFHAGFVWGLLQGLGAAAVLEGANAVAAMSCRADGAQDGLPDRTALEAFMREAGRGLRAEGEST
jgi:sulfofructose kinase